MRIVIPVHENKGKDSKISEHFGRSPYFAFVELNKTDYEVNIEKNPYEVHKPGEIPLYIKNKGVDLVITQGMGQRSLTFFEKFEIKVIRGANGTVEEIIGKFLKNELKDIEFEEKEHFHEH